MAYTPLERSRPRHINNVYNNYLKQQTIPNHSYLIFEHVAYAISRLFILHLTKCALDLHYSN